MSRYEPPIPVKEKEKEKALEFREMTNGGSKESKSEKQVEGDTDLSWNHEGLEPHPDSNKPKPPRSPKLTKVPKLGTKGERAPDKICPTYKGNHDEKDCLKFLFKEEKEEAIPPQTGRQSLQADKSEAKIEEKWDPVKEDSAIDKDTEKWVEEQNEFFEKEKERKEKQKQKEEVPAKFEPKGPVKILQRQRYASTIIPGQTPRRPRDSRYSQSQHDYWATGYEGARYGKEFGAGYSPKDKKWPQGSGYGKRYGTG